jgi:hypothetical protein
MRFIKLGRLHNQSKEAFLNLHGLKYMKNMQSNDAILEAKYFKNKIKLVPRP